MSAPDAGLPTFQAPFAPSDEELATGFFARAARDRAAESRIDARAKKLIEAIRARSTGLGGIDDFLHAYSLSTREGLALMVLAEALLRVPDAATADRLIEDKLAAGRWLESDVKSTAILVSASAWTLGLAASVIQPGETLDSILDTIVRRLGRPVMRAATRQAMRILGSHFVIGQTIAEARARARSHDEFLLFIRHARRGRAHGRRRGSLFRGLCRCDRAARGWRRQRGAAAPSRHFGQTLGAASALRGGVARTVAEGACAAPCRAGAARQGARDAVHRRRRGGGPARTVARHRCASARRSVAQWLGRFRACGAGLSEARASGDRVARGARRRDQSQAHGAPRQGRLLGHRDQARPGTRARRLSRIHAQGNDRPVLHGLRQKTPCRAQSPVSAIRHP